MSSDMDDAEMFEMPPEQKLRELIARQAALDEKLDGIDRELRVLHHLLAEALQRREVA